MEIKLINKETPVWIEEEPFCGRCQIGIEAVIPDNREDALRVVWTQGKLLLKGKEPGTHSLTVSGELSVSILYQTESGTLDTLRLKKEYEQSFELEEPDPDAPPQISCRLIGLEGKLLNPRKLSVSADVQTVLQPFASGSMSMDTTLPKDAEAGLHLLRESRECLALKKVQEKTFTIREQLQSQPDKSLPLSIAGESVCFSDLMTETLGTKSIVKGEAELRVWGLDEGGLPVSSRFLLPFSQLADPGEENADLIMAQAELSSVYLDWIDGGGGERSLEAELHGVLQLRCYKKQVASFVADAYSTRMPSTIVCEKRTFLTALERNTARLSGEESFPVPDDAVELLSSEAKLGLLESDRERISLPLTADLLYRSKDGSIGSVRRSMHLQGAAMDAGVRPRSLRLLNCENSMENGKLRLRAEAELLAEQQSKEQLDAVSSVELREDAAWNPSETPSLSLVFSHGENLWELAKEYRSTIEAISSCNPEGGNPLLIPAE